MMPKKHAESETEICLCFYKNFWLRMNTTYMTEMHTMRFVNWQNKTIFVGPSNDTVYRQLQLSFYVVHVFSLTKYVQVVNIPVTKHSGGNTFRMLFILSEKSETIKALSWGTPSSWK